MARITVEDCLKNVKNRFELVIIAAGRARQLMRGKEALVPLDNDKATVVALREIAKGYTQFDQKTPSEKPSITDPFAITTSTEDSEDTESSMSFETKDDSHSETEEANTEESTEVSTAAPDDAEPTENSDETND